MFCLLALLGPSLLVILALQLSLAFRQTALFLGLSPLFELTLPVLASPLVVVPPALPFALAFLFRPSLLVKLPAILLPSLPQLLLVVLFLCSSLLFRQASLLVGLPALVLSLTLLLPLPSLLSALLVLALPFGLTLRVALAALILCLTFVVTALLLSLTSLLCFFVPPGLILILILILILVPFPLFTAYAAVLAIAGFLGVGKAGGSQQSC
ncbi:MAG TPA: hypothetical protein VLN44_07255 [Pyrinomonadaceae bacterium]|nr:hypothetical protein [Pyrinomonadaceae bacterium]